MSLTETETLLIHKYIKGALESDDMVLFRQKTKNEIFRSELLKHVTVLKSINDKVKNDLLEKFEKINNAESSLETTDTLVKEKSKVKLALIPLLLIALAAIGYWISSNTQKTIPHYAETMINNSLAKNQYGDLSRGTSNEGIEYRKGLLKEEIKTSIKNNNHNQTLLLFGDLEKIETLNLEDKFYKASALIQLKKYDEAMVNLNEIIDKKKRFHSESLWLRALVHGIQGNNVQMKNDLTYLQNNTSYQSKNIETLLRNIKN